MTWRADGPLWSIDLALRCEGEREVAWELGAEVTGGAARRWLVPGVIHEPAGPRDSRATIPRIGPRDAGLTSEQWAFRTDRTPTPAVCCWTADAFAALAIEPHGAAGLTGVALGAGARPRIAVVAPYRELPVSYTGTVSPADAAWIAGGDVELRAWAYVAAPEQDAHAPLVRALYERLRGASLVPRVDLAMGATLAARGLADHHARHVAGVAILAETSSFDRDPPKDRESMHVAWRSGAPAAHALLAHGTKRASRRYLTIARDVLDTVASGIAPCGAFWGQWLADAGWNAGWNGDPALLHARTLAEATLFMTRSLAIERDHPDWETAVRSSCAVALRAQSRDGTFGTYWHARTGEVAEHDGTGGMLWIAALLEADRLLGIDGAAVAALRAVNGYAPSVAEDRLYGAPEDVHLAPTSEDAYCAVMAYAAAAERDPSWLPLAVRAADGVMTWRYSYDVAFAPDTPLGRLGFRTRGLDQASPQDQHLHAYGLVCARELAYVARETEDAYLAARARDALASSLQTVAREDGDMGAKRGMVAGRFLQTAYGGTKGDVVPDSHAWAAGLILFAANDALARGEDLPA